MASIQSCLILLKGYDWLRLHDKTAIYVKLVGLTITEILPFMILFVVALIGFGLPLTFLDLNRNDEGLIN